MYFQKTEIGYRRTMKLVVSASSWSGRSANATPGLSAKALHELTEVPTKILQETRRG